MKPVPNKEIIDRINALNSTQFENLTLDLVRAVGFQNVVWRTPGADGGRDIQAEENFSDLSGNDTKQKWYIECKHYSNSVDWPTLWKKVAYADSHGADFLLLVTNSQPSPHCETEIEHWNADRRRPGIRVWRGYDLPAHMRLHENVALAHGIVDSSLNSPSMPIDIAFALSKLVQAADGARSFDQDPELPLVSASTLSELFHKRMDDLRTYGSYSLGSPVTNISDWPWLKIQGNLGNQEEVSFRAMVAIIRHLLQAVEMKCQFSDNWLKLDAINPKRRLDTNALTFLKPILLLSRCDSFNYPSPTQVMFQLRGTK